jgi:hypothetical protein
MSRTRFQPVVAYRDLASNTLVTLAKGMAVTVTGNHAAAWTAALRAARTALLAGELAGRLPRLHSPS